MTQGAAGETREEARGRGPLAGRFALVVGGVSALVVLGAARLVLVNAEGPLADHSRVGSLAALGVAVVAGLLVAAAGAATVARSRVGAAVLVVVLAGSAWVLYPATTDVHESFRPQVNARSSCTGWSFRHYPPQTSDASAVDYCVGLERPVAPG